MRVVFFMLGLLSGAASAEAQDSSYLCIAEQGAAVTKHEGSIFGSFSGATDNKYIVGRRTGLRRFGIDANWLSECNYDESGRPTWCEMPGESWGGVFMMDSDGTFVIMSLNGNASNSASTDYYSVIGKCSQLQ